MGLMHRVIQTEESSLDDPEPESPSAGILSEASICEGFWTCRLRFTLSTMDLLVTLQYWDGVG